MEHKITEICMSIGNVVTESRLRKVPIPISGVIIELDDLTGEKAVALTRKQTYMAMLYGYALTTKQTYMEYVGSVMDKWDKV